MGSSLILTGGAATSKTLKESISLTSHGFSVGDVLRWNNGSPSYVRAQADPSRSQAIRHYINDGNNTLYLPKNDAMCDRWCERESELAILVQRLRAENGE